MNSNTLNDFRHEIYRCFGKAKDALFNLVDTLASEAGARSFPELSLSPLFERTWASLYEALEDGQIDVERLRESCVQFAPLPEKGQVVFLGIDTSNLYRPEAETAADRTLVKMANLPAKTHVASPGWVISSVVLLPRQASQGTFVLDTVRVRSTEQATEVAARQLRAVVALLVTRGLHPIILGDRWYACAPLLARMTDVDASCAVRVSKAIASFTARPQSGSPDKREPAARMGSVFNAAMNAPMANPMKPGKAPMTKVQRSRFVAGTTCTCAPLVGWNFRSFRSSAMEPAEASVIPGSAGLSGKATSRLRWPRSAQSTACVTLTNMAIASTSRNCSGTLHGSRPRSAPNAGHNWWPVRTICWSWLVPWWKAATARGKTDVRNSR